MFIETRDDCRGRRTPAGLRGFALALLMAMAIGLSSGVAFAQHHEDGAAAEAPHGQTVLQTVAKLANFAILAGVLVYFLRTPIRTYLQSRATAIRSDLVAASEMRATATAQLAEIER